MSIAAIYKNHGDSLRTYDPAVRSSPSALRIPGDRSHRGQYGRGLGVAEMKGNMLVGRPVAVLLLGRAVPLPLILHGSRKGFYQHHLLHKY